MGIEIELVLVRRSPLTCFFVRAENDVFLMWRSIDLVLVCVGEMDLVFVFGPKTNLFQFEHRT